MVQDGSNYEVLEFAIRREVEAYYFYMALAERVDSAQMRQVLKDFAEEELEHKAKLELEVLKTGHTINEELPEASHDNYIISKLFFELEILCYLLFLEWC